MIIHIGRGYFADGAKVLGIFDFENTTVEEATREYLKNCQNSGYLIDATEKGLPKSFIVCEDYTYLSEMSVVTLKKRLLKNTL